MKRIILYLWISMAFSCTTEQDRYYKEFLKYFEEVHGESLKEYDGYVYVVHLQGCSTCIESSFRLLNSVDQRYRDQFVIIVVGKQSEENLFPIENIESKYNKVLRDDMQKIFNYQTNFAYPLYMKIKEGKYVEYKDVVLEDYTDLTQKFK